MWLCRYQEDPVGVSAMRPGRRGEHMIKQTYSVYVEKSDGMKKWHLSSSSFHLQGSIESAHEFPDAYWTVETLDRLLTVDDIPELRSLEVAPGTYLCARTTRNRMQEVVSRSARNLFSEEIAHPSPSALPEYAPYPYQRRPADEPLSSAPLSPSSSVSSQAGNGMTSSSSPRIYATRATHAVAETGVLPRKSTSYKY